MLAQLFVALQYVLPQHLLTALVWRITRIRHAATKNFLISRFVDLSDDLERDIPRPCRLERGFGQEIGPVGRLEAEDVGVGRRAGTGFWRPLLQPCLNDLAHADLLLNDKIGVTSLGS